METGISRRGFVAGAATGAAALAAAGTAFSGGAALAEESAAAAGGQARARWSWEQAPEAPADSEVAEAYDCDVCVICAGSAGVPAALYAATHGLSVVVLQKWFSTQSNGFGRQGVLGKRGANPSRTRKRAGRSGSQGARGPACPALPRGFSLRWAAFRGGAPPRAPGAPGAAGRRGAARQQAAAPRAPRASAGNSPAWARPAWR